MNDNIYLGPDKKYTRKNGITWHKVSQHGVTRNLTALESPYALDMDESSGATFTLPSAADNGGKNILIIDRYGKLSGTNKLDIVPSGSDTAKNAASITLDAPFQRIRLMSDGISDWMVVGGNA